MVQKHYEKCRDEGTSHSLAEMFAFEQAPCGVSDGTFMRGTENGRQFQGQQKMGNYYRHITEQKGGNTNGKKYLSGLAAYPGDPEAWVSGRDDVRRILEKRGWGCEGTMSIKPRESIGEPDAGPTMAADLVEKYAQQIAASVPDSHLVDMDDLKSQVVERMAPKKRGRKATKATKERVVA